MSISVTIIKRDKKRLALTGFVETYIKSLEMNYNREEMQSFVYGENEEGVLGFVFEDNSLEEKTTEDILIKRHTVTNRDFVSLKFLHRNSHKSRAKLINTFKTLVENREVSFVALEHTAMQTYGMDAQPPRVTKAGSIYLDMGTITRYFKDLPNKNGKLPSSEVRGLEFAATMQGKSEAEIIDAYFSRFIDTQNHVGLTDIEQTGLPHFTTVISDCNGKPTVWLLQNIRRIRTARYFFEPDYFFCSNERITRAFQELYYENTDTQIKNLLQKMQVPLI
jgi:hypothetical protein